MIEKDHKKKKKNLKRFRGKTTLIQDLVWDGPDGPTHNEKSGWARVLSPLARITYNLRKPTTITKFTSNTDYK